VAPVQELGKDGKMHAVNNAVTSVPMLVETSANSTRHIA